MNIDSIENGLVIDHIKAGKAMRLYELLGLQQMDVPIALIQNAVSKKMGKKDIIKIDSGDIKLDLDIIGFVDPDATVNVIKNGKLEKKMSIDVPLQMVNVLKCKNPRCITTTEQELPQIFNLTDRENMVYRCKYCEASGKSDEL